MTGVCVSLAIALGVMGGASSDVASLTLIPPSVVSENVTLDVRVGVRNEADAAREFDVSVFWDVEEPQTLIHRAQLNVPARSAKSISAHCPASAHLGEHRILAVVSTAGKTCRTERPVRVEKSEVRSLGRLNGAWVDLYHHDDAEGRPFNDELGKMTDAQWRELVRAMHAVDQDILVITMVFQNFMHVGKHNIGRDGYHGKAYYPSALYAGRMPIASEDPLEAILDEADKLGMYVLPSVGVYAFFDFTRESLAWHEAVADELWARYGHHASFYGWYVSDEVGGNLGTDDKRRQELAEFFREFRAHVQGLAPDKPVMLATNCHFVDRANGYYAKLLPNLDILCPFGFARMPEGDMTGEAAAAFLQEQCDAAGCHLWMDLESFEFRNGAELHPRAIGGIVDDLKRFTQFETVLHYEFPGMMSSPEMSRRPGGDGSVKLYEDYRGYLKNSP